MVIMVVLIMRKMVVPQKIPIAGWFVNGKSYFLIDDLGVAYFRTPPYLNQSSLLYG
jgi:hypothetical protein